MLPGVLLKPGGTAPWVDADHLKNETDIDNCVAAGYSFYTFDPGAYVYNEVDAASDTDIQEKVSALPWQFLKAPLRIYTLDTMDEVLILVKERLN